MTIARMYVVRAAFKSTMHMYGNVGASRALVPGPPAAKISRKLNVLVG